MRWFKDLYIGESAGRRASSIIRKVNKNKLQRNVFLITKASNGYDLFDIYPSYVFLQKHYRNEDYLIIGIAIGYGEAVGIVQNIIEELYCEKGVTDLKGYFES